jgi:hypothetical protein
MRSEYLFQNIGLFNWWARPAADWPLEIFSGLVRRLTYTEWVKSDVIMKAGGQLETAWSGYGYVLQNEYEEWFRNHIQIGMPEPTGDYIDFGKAHKIPMYAIPIHYSIDALEGWIDNMPLIYQSAAEKFVEQGINAPLDGGFTFEWIFNSLMMALFERNDQNKKGFNISEKWSRTYLENPNGTNRGFENYEETRPFRLLAFVLPPDSTSKNIAYSLEKQKSEPWFYEPTLSEDKKTATYTIFAVPFTRSFAERNIVHPAVSFSKEESS